MSLRLRCVGHVERMEGERITKNLIQGGVWDQGGDEFEIWNKNKEN